LKLRNFLLHTRPKSFLPSFLFPLTGYFASPLHFEAAENVKRLGVLFLGYCVLIWGGTSALNSAWDGDEGPLNFLENPPPVPQGLGIFGFALLLLGVAVFYPYGTLCMEAAAICLALSCLYSVRFPGLPRRGKEVPVLDNLINALGCGALAVFLGYGVGGGGLSPRVLVLALAFTLTVFGSYPATQVFQLDSRGKDGGKKTNFSAFFGAKTALRIGVVFLVGGGALALSTVADPYAPG
jgi:4-hydroxybenzoate polyprenyltransferase